MHGRKRSDYKAKRASEAASQKASQLRALEQELLQRKRKRTAKEQQQHENPTTQQQQLSLLKLDLDLSGKYLVVNPDPLWLWNDRREILLRLFEFNADHDNDGDDDNDNNNTDPNRRLLDTELSLTATCLQNNPKSYGAWVHRKWLCMMIICCRFRSSHQQQQQNCQEFWQQELALTQQFLTRDERNFHCWNYRRHVVSLLLQHHGATFEVREADGDIQDDDQNNNDGDSNKDGGLLSRLYGPQVVLGEKSTASSSSSHNTAGSDPEAVRRILQGEWEFTTEKIQENFSNCSAIHYRSKLFPILLNLNMENNNNNQDWDGTCVLKTEWDLVENAIFTEPYDQTAWWYQRFLLEQSTTRMTSPMTAKQEDDTLAFLKAMKDRLQAHVEQLQALREDEPDCKWVWLGLAQALERLQLLFIRLHDHPPSEQQSQDDDPVRSSISAQLMEIWEHLCELDPDRKRRYQVELNKITT